MRAVVVIRLGEDGAMPLMSLAPQPVDLATLRLARIGQGCRRRRCACDQAKRRWYARCRLARLSARLMG